MRVKKTQFSRSNLFRCSQGKQKLGEQTLQQQNDVKKSDSIHLPKIESSLQSYQSTSRSGMDALESYVHKLLTQEQDQLFNLRRHKKQKKQQQIVQQGIALVQQKEKKNRQKLYLNQLIRKLNELKDLQKLEQKKLMIENAMSRRMTDGYNQLFPKKSKDNSKSIEVQTQTSANTLIDGSPQARGPVKRKRLVRKFRIAVFVVYFSLAFPKYVKIFREIRKVYFRQKVIKLKSLQRETTNYVKLLSEFKIDSFFRDISKQKRKQKDDSPTFSFGQIDEEGNESSFSIKLSHISQMSLFMLKNIVSTIKAGEVNELFKAFSYYFLDRSFLADQIFLIDQLYRLKVNLQSKTILLDKDQEIMLLIYAFLSKITVFSFMVAGERQNENGSKKKLKKKGKKIKAQNIEHQKTLLMGGLYLFHKCNENKINIEKDSVFRKEGNIEQVQKNEFPKPKSDLIIGEHFEIQLNMGSRKRTSIEQSIMSSFLNNIGIKYKFMQKMEDLVQAIVDNNNVQSQIQSLIGQISNQIHKKCLSYRKQHFDEVHLSAINHKYYLTKPIQQEDLFMKRLPNQINSIQQCLKMIVEARTLANKKKKGVGKMVTVRNINSKQSILSGFSSNKNSNISIKQTESIWGSKDQVLERKESDKESITSILRGSSILSSSKDKKNRQATQQAINSGTSSNTNKENQNNHHVRIDKNKKRFQNKPLETIEEGNQNKD